MSEPAIREAILAVTTEAGPAHSVSTEDVARTLATENWQSLLTRIRREAVLLAQEGRIDILRKGRPADPTAEIRGVIRLRLRA